jgi:hypothetical protein
MMRWPQIRFRQRGISFSDPVQRLLRRRDVVAMTGEAMIGARIALSQQAARLSRASFLIRRLPTKKLFDNQRISGSLSRKYPPPIFKFETRHRPCQCRDRDRYICGTVCARD